MPGALYLLLSGPADAVRALELLRLAESQAGSGDHGVAVLLQRLTPNPLSLGDTIDLDFEGLGAQAARILSIPPARGIAVATLASLAVTVECCAPRLHRDRGDCSADRVADPESDGVLQSGVGDVMQKRFRTATGVGTHQHLSTVGGR